MHSIMEKGQCYTNLSDKNKLQRLVYTASYLLQKN